MSAQFALTTQSLALFVLTAKVKAASAWMFMGLYTKLDLNQENLSLKARNCGNFIF
jgi:hypothetical protein